MALSKSWWCISIDGNVIAVQAHMYDNKKINVVRVLPNKQQPSDRPAHSHTRTRSTRTSHTRIHDDNTRIVVVHTRIVVSVAVRPRTA